MMERKSDGGEDVKKKAETKETKEKEAAATSIILVGHVTAWGNIEATISLIRFG
jgi:hypothetical protein